MTTPFFPTSHNAAQNALEKRYEELLSKTAQDMLQNWQRETEASMAKTVSAMMQGLLGAMGQSLGASTPPPRIEFETVFGSDNATLNQVLKPLESQVNSWIKGALRDATRSSKTTTRSVESARSQEMDAAFRASRGQAQAQALAAAERGRRNT